MKTTTLTFVALIWASNLVAQTLNPRQYAVLPRESISTDKRKDGTYTLPSFSPSESLFFTPNAEYLYLLNTREKDEGKLIIYNVAKKSVEKTFKMPKTGMYTYRMLVYNPENMYQLAVATSKSEITVLPDWRTEPDDAFAKKKPENSKRVTATGKIEYADFAFSVDGKSLYLQENEVDQPKVIDLATGKTEKKVMPKGKKLYWSIDCTPFIGNDEAFIITQKDKKSADRVVDIYHIPTAQIIRSYEISEVFGKPENFTYKPYFLFYYGGMLHLKTGEKDESTAQIAKAIRAIKDNSATAVLPVMGRGYVVSQLYYKKEKLGSQFTSTTSSTGLFFLNKDGSKASTNFSGVNTAVPNAGKGSFQISPNGKYIVFEHDDDNDEANSKWIIATL